MKHWPFSPELSQSIVLVLIDASVRAAILITVSFLVSRVSRSFSSAARHLLWCGVLLSVLLLPALSRLLPPWELQQPALLTQSALSRNKPVNLSIAPTRDV